MDDNHIDPVFGEEVFDEEKEATSILLSVNSWVDVPQDVVETSREASVILVEVDRKLAETAQDEAERRVKANQVLSECVREMGIARQHQEQGHFDRAIEHYKQA